MSATTGVIRTVLGDVAEVPPGVVYTHEHLIIDSALIAASFPHIHLDNADAAVSELKLSSAAGAALFVDTMPASAGRDAVRLADISRRSGVAIVATTGLHHDRYYGPLHWSNRVGVEELTELFVADLLEGIDEFDYTGPIVRRTDIRAGLVKAATSGVVPDARDRRNLEAVAAASVATGAPVMTHCEGGWGALAQLDLLERCGVPPSATILSHLDKTEDLSYLLEVAARGAYLELDQTLRQRDRGAESITVRAIRSLVDAGFGSQIVVGTDGARRSLWASFGGSPGLAWLASGLPPLLVDAGLDAPGINAVMRDNALAALRWRGSD